MKESIKYLFLIVLLFLFQAVYAQEIRISYISEGKPLNMVLEELSFVNSVKFGYDSDLFREIQTNFQINNYTLENFLHLLKEKYFVRSQLIEGTWVLVIREPEIVEQPKPAPEPVKLKMISVGGYVKDKLTGEDLLYCNVIYGQNRGAMTNDLGFFSFSHPDTESVRILISHLGYKRLDTLINAKQTAALFLDPSEFMMETIVVKQIEKSVLEATPQPEKIGFNPAKTANTPRISSDDMINSLLYIPGVNFLQGSSAGLSIRGSMPADNLILLDGIPVLETSHLLGNISVLNSKFVQQAFVSRSGFDAEFGGKVAGLIELIGKSGKNKRPYLDISANLLNSNILVNIPVTNKFSITTAWRRSYIDRWQNYLYFRLFDDVGSENTNGNTVTSSIYPEIKYQDVNTKVSFHPSDNLEFNINLLYSDDYQSRDYELLRTEEYYRNESMKSENLGFSFNWNWQINNNWYQSLTAGYTDFYKRVIDETGQLQVVTDTITSPGQGKGKGKGLAKTREKTYNRQIYDIDNAQNNIEEFRLAWKTEYKTGNLRNQVGVGWNANTFSYNYFANRSIAEIPVDSVVNKSTQYLLTGFLQQHIQITDALKFRWGINANVDLTTRKAYWQPRTGFEYSPVPSFSFHFSSGVYHQFLSSVKRIDSEGHFTTVWYLPNYEGNGVVKATHHVFGGKYEENGWMINAEAYLKNTGGKMNLFAEPVSNKISYYLYESNERSKGIDLFLQKKQGILNHMIGYSISKTDEKMENILDGSWYPDYNDRLHRLKVTEMLTWKNWNLTGSWNFGSGLPVINLTGDNLIQSYVRSDYFSQLDFSLTKKVYIPHFILEAGVSLLNVLGRNNIVEVDYLRFTSETGSLTVRTDISALSFTPVFFVSLKLQ